MTTNDVAEEQNDETAVEIELEAVVEQAMAEFDEVASITIDHPMTYERPKMIYVRVYTGEADSVEDYLGLFTGNHRIAIERGDETLLVPFGVFATFDGPVTWDSVEQTTIYMQNVIGAKPVRIEDGLAYVRDKLEHPDQWSEEQSTQLERIRNYSE